MRDERTGTRYFDQGPPCQATATTRTLEIPLILMRLERHVPRHGWILERRLSQWLQRAPRLKADRETTLARAVVVIFGFVNLNSSFKRTSPASKTLQQLHQNSRDKSGNNKIITNFDL